jgi:hypothetical protein
MSEPTNLTSPNPVIDTRPNTKGALLPSVQDYYERYRNPNLFISNNANPFLISPYAPNQISQTTKNSILATDVIKPFTPNRVIRLEGSMVAEPPNYFLTGDKQPLLHYAIYSPNNATPAVVAACSTAFTPEFAVSFSGNPRLTIDNTGALFTDGAGTFALNVEGSVAIDASLVPSSNTLDLTTTPLSAAAPVTLQGYLPVLVNGAQRYVPFYSNP